MSFRHTKYIRNDNSKLLVTWNFISKNSFELVNIKFPDGQICSSGELWTTNPNLAAEITDYIDITFFNNDEEKGSLKPNEDTAFTFNEAIAKDIEKSGLVYTLGKLKTKISLYNDGFIVIGRKDFCHKWDNVKRVTYNWQHTTYNALGHSHRFDYSFELKNGSIGGAGINPVAMYYDISSRFIRKFIKSLKQLAVEHSIIFDMEWGS